MGINFPEAFPPKIIIPVDKCHIKILNNGALTVKQRGRFIGSVCSSCLTAAAAQQELTSSNYIYDFIMTPFYRCMSTAVCAYEKSLILTQLNLLKALHMNIVLQIKRTQLRNFILAFCGYKITQ